jgi:acetoacetyl-CoA synthetase
VLLQMIHLILLTYPGVRFGTAELYAVVDRFAEVEDCIAVGQKLAGGKDEQVLLFLKLRKGRLDMNLRGTICAAIREALSARHVPAHVVQVDDIPYTVNGKKMENLVRNLVNGKPVTTSGTAENPKCLQQYRQFRTPAVAERESKL